ncbi:hypothetical protein MCOR27_001266 [Pyricularia oryzae]|uniref:Endoplasmic reticulum-Golgi intermediate compartment protein n=5 Tax=Pyricularia TaxID=48558 RepID=A0ABQ8NH06_PYRGI|nr:endoplasmic reticulum-Golgi intermediate compartment protein 2 [Pyricularia oryzae 70-15]ELQ33987.1 endoplasmic reticulum-Golgi intermediate compartment protein 2 [Pyricularia oryzae Y34]KAH8840394.1 hypothetical protein MCOR01_007104 [Pyricularia oryzae]KAI6296832.1 hypothetical protein MCOR33_006638 [Pyricularia grisea]EHA48418.1 endoplasmic reticulum-Golgi intermediate compartment protein 2 [Pyricularia oryzae 70-15]KAH9434310.1 hypothetical protein MCOR02_006326 [Pyricularia oryzae]
MMNGYEKNNHDEDPFAPSGSVVSAFDAFPKSKPQYVTRTSGGGKWTVAMLLVSAILTWSELARWWRGVETHTFAVEKGVGQSMQINMDTVVHMRCQDIHVNVQDAAGDRIMAAARLKMDDTTWAQWVDGSGVHRLGHDQHGKVVTGEGHEEGFGEEHIHDIVALGKKRARWSKTPRLWGATPDSCRIFGSLDLNKVQGDFHITARGHGYIEFGDHLDHSAFNFSHIVNEFSFGDFYPSLVNPLDKTVNTCEKNFHKFQYFLSVVPTLYSVKSSTGAFGYSTIFTNQYAVTEQSSEISEMNVPGIFFKYDIEPILLDIEESRDTILVFLIKVINILSGAMVAGHWGFTMSEWIKEVLGKRRRASSNGVLGNKAGYDE